MYGNTSYGAHYGMKEHTGGLMSIGKEAFHVKSSKQKIKINSFTKTEIVGSSDYIPWAYEVIDTWKNKLIQCRRINLTKVPVLKIRNNSVYEVPHYVAKSIIYLS